MDQFFLFPKPASEPSNAASKEDASKEDASKEDASKYDASFYDASYYDASFYDASKNVTRDSSEYLGDDWMTEDYRPTVVHSLPEYLSQPVTQKADAEPDEFTFGRLLFHLFLLALTVLTTTFAVGLFWLGGVREGMVYSFTVLSILGAHEMGHYIACRWYGVRATLPYFIPVPIPPVGTFGAFIKIKSPIPSRR